MLPATALPCFFSRARPGSSRIRGAQPLSTPPPLRERSARAALRETAEAWLREGAGGVRRRRPPPVCWKVRSTPAPPGLVRCGGSQGAPRDPVSAFCPHLLPGTRGGLAPPCKNSAWFYSHPASISALAAFIKGKRKKSASSNNTQPKSKTCARLKRQKVAILEPFLLAEDFD